MRVKTLKKDANVDLSQFPNFSKTGSIKGMKKLYYGKDALLVKFGFYIYNVTQDFLIYYNLSN